MPGHVTDGFARRARVRDQRAVLQVACFDDRGEIVGEAIVVDHARIAGLPMATPIESHGPEPMFADQDHHLTP